ncbi:MAG TPA: hypothetical protein VIK55_14115 [Paludibacter sp.]
MGKINLYTNDQAVKSDLAALDQAKKQVESISTFLISKGIEPDAINMKNACKKVFTIPVESFKQIEVAKIKKLIDIIGSDDSVATEGWPEKVDNKTNLYHQDLINLCPVLDQSDYLKYFSFENGISVKPEFDNQYFIDKHSVILSPEQLDFYNKHIKACQLLNELICHPDSEFEALDKLFYFNPESKEFEMSIKVYHDIEADLIAEKKRKEDEEYTKLMQERYRQNQVNIRLNRGPESI